jgi:atypical dual specificity phosphatase
MSEDMGAPSIAAARTHCREVARLMDAGEVVALHCRAGLGRTGTMLAAQLVHEGASALDALEAVRRVEPRWVQSHEQIEFLERFAADERVQVG